MNMVAGILDLYMIFSSATHWWWPIGDTLHSCTHRQQRMTGCNVNPLPHISIGKLVKGFCWLVGWSLCLVEMFFKVVHTASGSNHPGYTLHFIKRSRCRVAGQSK